MENIKALSNSQLVQLMRAISNELKTRESQIPRSTKGGGNYKQA